MVSLKFLDQAPRFLFFTGKGGVGKTSVACATSMQLADQGYKVLLVSTDPASNIGQAFGLTIGNRITPIAAAPGLSALEIDPQAAAQAYRDRIVAPVKGLLPDAVVSSIEEQLSGACTTEIAAFDEFTALLTDSELVASYQHIVFDTAPTGHTIRLLQLPGAWSGFLKAGKGDASCLGPLAGLDKQRTQYQAAVDALSDNARTRLILVARAQQTALREVARTQAELAAIGLNNQYLLINAVLSAEQAADDSLASAIQRREQEALAFMPEALAKLPRDEVLLKPFNMVGLAALRELLDDGIHAEEPPASGSPAHSDHPGLAALVDQIAEDGRGLVMFMGKGGVGKTTLACAIAVDLAGRGLPVHLTTSDPAAHLQQTLDGALDCLTVSCIDPRAETERYRQHVLATKGNRLDAEGRALLEEDLRSPCTEEIAVFQAFSRIIREAGEKLVVMDTAPTGHTLLLLDATGAYHREVTRQAQTGAANPTPMMQLQNGRQTKVLIATLAETTPVLEAANLQNDLRRAGIEPWAWIVNNSIAAAQTQSPLLRQRAANELKEIDAIARCHARRYAVVPLLREEPVGNSRLQALTGRTQANNGRAPKDHQSKTYGNA